jgi:hypothetical protein
VVFDWKIEDYKRFLSDPEIPAIAGARPPRVAGESWSRRPVRLTRPPEIGPPDMRVLNAQQGQEDSDEATPPHP